MPESRLFFQVIDLGGGSEVPPDVVAEALDIRKQLGDNRGVWTPVSVSSGAEGFHAIYREASEQGEYMFVRYPMDDDGSQRYDCFQLTIAEPVAIARWETGKVPPIAREFLSK